MAWKIVKSFSNESFEKFAKIPIEFTTKKLGEGKNPLAIFGHLCQEKILYSETMYILRILFYCTRAAFTTLQAAAKGNPICKTFTACCLDNFEASVEIFNTYFIIKSKIGTI